MSGWLFITVLGFVIAAVTIVDGMRAREQAIMLASRFCQQGGLQLLDGSVALRRWSLRVTHGVSFLRRYEFQYSCQDNQRHSGLIVLLGDQLVEFLLMNGHTNVTLAQDTTAPDDISSIH